MEDHGVQRHGGGGYGEDNTVGPIGTVVGKSFLASRYPLVPPGWYYRLRIARNSVNR
jgi:hypothetical protein